MYSGLNCISLPVKSIFGILTPKYLRLSHYWEVLSLRRQLNWNFRSICTVSRRRIIFSQNYAVITCSGKLPIHSLGLDPRHNPTDPSVSASHSLEVLERNNIIHATFFVVVCCCSPHKLEKNVLAEFSFCMVCWRFVKFKR